MLKLNAFLVQLPRLMRSGSQRALLFMCLMLSTLALEAQTPKVAFSGVTRTDSPDGFSFVAGEDLATGTVVYFTDEEYRVACGAFHFDDNCTGTDGEPYLMYTVPTGGLTAGEVVFISETGSNIFTITGGGGTVVYGGTGNFTLSASDALHAFATSDASNPLDNVTEIYTSLLLGAAFDGSASTGDDPRLDFPKAVVTILNAANGEYNPSLRSNMTTDADIEDVANWNIPTAPTNLVLSTVNFTGGIDLCPLPTGICPTIGAVAGPSGTICDGGAFGIIATELANFDEELNNDQTYGLRFVAFAGTTDDPYTGGTSLGTVSFIDFTGDGGIAMLSGATLPVGTYTLYAVLNPMPADESCRPSALGTVTIAALPTVNLDIIETVDVDAGIQTGLGGGTPVGGVYSGPGVTDDNNGMTYTFDPFVAGIGVTVVMYDYIDMNGCGGSAIDDVTITPPALPGDNCDDAIDLSPLFGQVFNIPQISNLYDNSTFTSGADDPITGFDCFYQGDALQNTGWYSFAGDGNTYRVRSVQCIGPNANLDLQVAVYSGTCGSLTDIACNEDEDGGASLFNFNVTFATEVGVEYLILVDGFDSESGAFCIEVTNLTDALLPGDMCANAIDVSSLTGQAEMVPQLSETYNNLGYFTDATDPDGTMCQAIFGNSFWFTFTGDGNRYTVSGVNPAPDNFDLYGTILSGDCENLTEISCSNDGLNGEDLDFGLELQTIIGETYYIIVDDGLIDPTGTFNLEFVNLGTTSVTDLSSTEFRVFPNPTTGNIQLPQIELERVEVYDATGRLVLRQQQPVTSIDLAAQPAGLYLLKLYNGKEVYSAKVVKE